MNDNIKLGRLAGFPVAADWSVLIIAWLLTWTLATSMFPHHGSGGAELTYWLTAVGTSIIFFGSLLAHEIAHAVVARRHGVEVKGLTLWLFGGFASLGSEPSTPRADVRIAVAGPAVSIVLGAGFELIALGLRALDIARLASVAAGWLAVINVVLGVFNLLPGAPLDGGRILRAFLWHRHGDQLRATVAAARAGGVVGLVLILLALADTIQGAAMSGLWLALTGWFILSSARAQQHDANIRTNLAGTRVADVMTTDLAVAPGSMTVRDFLHGFPHASGQSAYPVRNAEGGIVGVVTLAQLRRLAPDRADAELGHVAVNLAEVPVAAPEDLVVPLIDRIEDSMGGLALVLDHGVLSGGVTPADISRAAKELPRRPQWETRIIDR